jgi:integrase
LPARKRRPLPHIYSDSEIAELMCAAGRLRSAAGLRCATFQTLIGLLASTGLRPGEALALDVADVDLVGGVMAVRESNFGKSRFVPLEDSTRAALVAYTQLRDAVRPCRKAAAFLVTERGSRLRGCTTWLTFAMLGRAVGIRPEREAGRRVRGPRLQDFRHYPDRRIIPRGRVRGACAGELSKWRLVDAG